MIVSGHQKNKVFLFSSMLLWILQIVLHCTCNDKEKHL